MSRSFLGRLFRRGNDNASVSSFHPTLRDIPQLTERVYLHDGCFSSSTTTGRERIPTGVEERVLALPRGRFTVELRQLPNGSDVYFCGRLTRRGSGFRRFVQKVAYVSEVSSTVCLEWSNTLDSPPDPKYRVRISGQKFWCDDSQASRGLFGICIETSPTTSFYVAAADPEKRLDWLLYFSAAGGHFIGTDVRQIVESVDRRFFLPLAHPDPDLNLLVTTDLVDWTNTMVMNWVRLQTFNRFRDDARFRLDHLYSEFFENWNGRDLMTVTEDSLLQAGMTNLPHRKKVMRWFRELRISNRFVGCSFIVTSKLCRLLDWQKGFRPNVTFLGRCLTEPECLMMSFLDPYMVPEGLDYLIKGTNRINKSIDRSFVEEIPFEEAAYCSDPWPHILPNINRNRFGRPPQDNVRVCIQSLRRRRPISLIVRNEEKRSSFKSSSTRVDFPVECAPQMNSRRNRGSIIGELLE